MLNTYLLQFFIVARVCENVIKKNVEKYWFCSLVCVTNDTCKKVVHQHKVHLSEQPRKQRNNENRLQEINNVMLCNM